MKKRKTSNKGASPISKTALAIIFSFLTMMVLSLVGSLILTMLKSPIGSVPISSLIILLSSAAISGFVISRRTEGNFGFSLLACAIFAIMLTALSLIFSGGKVSMGIFMNYLCYVLVGGLFAFFGKNSKNKSRKKHKH